MNHTTTQLIFYDEISYFLNLLHNEYIFRMHFNLECVERFVIFVFYGENETGLNYHKNWFFILHRN